MKKYLLFFSLFSACSGGVHAENDYFSNILHKNTDSQYTHGTQFDIVKDMTPGEAQIYSIGQTIETPSEVHSDVKYPPALIKKDRPYGGFLYGQYEDELIKSDTLKDTFGLQVGCIGRCSRAEESQRLVHKLIGDYRPAWPNDDKLKSEPGVILEFKREKSIYVQPYMDFGFYGGGRVGNIIDNASIGSSTRIGYNLDTFMARPIVFKIPQKVNPWTAYGFLKLEERAVAYNQLLDGSLFQSEPHTVTSEPFVDELDIGVTFGYDIYKITYTYTYFGKEWTTEKPGGHVFGGIDLQW